MTGDNRWSRPTPQSVDDHRLAEVSAVAGDPGALVLAHDETTQTASAEWTWRREGLPRRPLARGEIEPLDAKRTLALVEEDQ
jgi:hypothetical protein